MRESQESLEKSMNNSQMKLSYLSTVLNSITEGEKVKSSLKNLDKELNLKNVQNNVKNLENRVSYRQKSK